MGVISCYYSVYQNLFNIKLAWVVRGMMGAFQDYCFISVSIHKDTSAKVLFNLLNELRILYFFFATSLINSVIQEH